VSSCSPQDFGLYFTLTAQSELSYSTTGLQPIIHDESFLWSYRQLK